LPNINSADISRQRIFAYLIRATPFRLALQLRSRER
jgi:hypothetical protein